VWPGFGSWFLYAREPEALSGLVNSLGGKIVEIIPLGTVEHHGQGMVEGSIYCAKRGNRNLYTRLGQSPQLIWSLLT
jgi:hypothetical protein